MTEISKSNWNARGDMAKIQEEKFAFMNARLVEQNRNVPLDHFDYIEKLSKEFIEEYKLHTCPIEVDMKKLLLNRSSMNEYIDEIVEKIVGADKKNQNYIYVVQREDGMVLVVGKSSVTYKEDRVHRPGDLFYRLNLSGLAGTANIILRAQYGNEIEEKLINYYYKAWVIPIIEGNSVDFEGKLGEFLIKKEVPILNYYSHK